jgi:hypothetical protein
MTLHIPSHGGGVVLLGSPDTQRTDELLVADGFDIGPRGQLICASDLTDYVSINFSGAAAGPIKQVYGLADVILDNVPNLLVVGEALDFATGLIRKWCIANLPRTGAVGPVAAATLAATVPVGGLIVTIHQWPGTFVFGGVRGSFIMINLGAREGFYPRTGLGLYAVFYDPGAGSMTFLTGVNIDFLGTGAGSSSFAGGTKGKNLYPRGIYAFNNHLFAYGFDNADATNGDGPARIMFSNLGDPRKFGNDNQATAGDRDYTDSDAIVLGDVGEAIRGAIKWRSRLYFGSNQQLHYIGGAGRDSFLTDGANPVAKSYNIVGPYALIEGPDQLLYQVSDQGLVCYDGASFEPHFKRLVDFHGHSTGYWDLIWTDPAAGAGYPGRTNQDLVWTAVDWDREQVLIGIPFCNAIAGAGVGNDTVVIKFHTRSKGFTRQVFSGVALTQAGYFRREGQQREVRIMATATVGKTTIQRYAYQATPTSSPVLPASLPVARFGPYAPFGPDGEGVIRRLYLSVAWEAAASLPIVFNIFTLADDALNDGFRLSIQAAAPGAPAAGDVWVDTSQTDINLGNAVAGVLVPATGGYLVRTWSGTAWRLIPGSGEQGTRGRIPLPLTRRTAGRVTAIAQCIAAAGRFQLEGLGIDPGGGTDSA